LGSCCENYRSSQNNGATFFHGKSNVVIFTKNVFGYILGDFFTNASGHPGVYPPATNVQLRSFPTPFHRKQFYFEIVHFIYTESTNAEKTVSVDYSLKVVPAGNNYDDFWWIFDKGPML
jgi:hypothetical protein